MRKTILDTQSMFCGAIGAGQASRKAGNIRQIEKQAHRHKYEEYYFR
jgi:hypothetical protein